MKIVVDSTMSDILCDADLVNRLPVNWLLFYADSGIKSQVCEGVEEEEKDGVYDP